MENQQVIKYENDLGMIIQVNLANEKQINRIFGFTLKQLTKTKIAFHSMEEDKIRPRLKYVTFAWSPHRKRDVKGLKQYKRQQRRLYPA